MTSVAEAGIASARLRSRNGLYEVVNFVIVRHRERS